MNFLGVIVFHVVWTSAIFFWFSPYYPVQWSEIIGAWFVAMLWIVGSMTLLNLLKDEE